MDNLASISVIADNWSISPDILSFIIQMNITQVYSKLIIENGSIEYVA